MNNLTYSDLLQLKITDGRQVDADSPVALFLLAKHEPRGIFHDRELHHLILQIANSGYQVAIKEISDASLLRNKIQETSEELHKNISFLTMVGHGDNDHIRFGDEENESESTRLTKSTVKKEDFSSLDEGAKIVLFSCSTGRELAQDIANISERTVTATRNLFLTSYVFFNSNTKSLICADNVPNFYEYRSGEEPTPIISNEIDIKEAYTERIFYLNDLAKKGDAIAEYNIFRSTSMLWKQVYGDDTQGDEEILYWCHRAAAACEPNALHSLGYFHEKGMYGLQKSDSEALKCYLAAAQLGCAEAQHKMGIFYETGRGGLIPSDNKAFDWYRLSFLQDYLPAQFSVANFIERGRGGCTQSDEGAISLYRPLAMQGFKEAEHKVGLFFLKGRGGLEQSNEKARESFLLAANKGHREAEYHYGICCKNGIGGERSEPKALIYLNKALAKGSPEAERAIEEIRANSPELFTTPRTIFRKEE